ncbi:MAG TPA: Crp/Fnr family transcriptional regulator [Flavobacterium sp.]|uniref:Crp/Fnr family transcriptional regulator n=1 Tax=Flavobacterium sp. TaxID=239 RepID=UPI002DBE6A6C|nr:Crp/Fnr family transcriptional regulator [Flavobacterium sp.]HEU4791106.1 Crp/Fnr family transcriptional regulator [Flavobacterium sp.]
MPYCDLKKQLLSIVSFTEEELDKICGYFESNSYSPKDFILTTGTVSNKIHFITTGLIRVFHLKEDKEITSYLACDIDFVTAFSSYINQSKSFEAIQCIETTETLSITYDKMQELYQIIPKCEKIGRIMAEQNYLCMADRILKLQMVPAKEKYQAFLQTAHPKIIQRTPLIHIASYLGITPESLSRIRKSIS